LHRPHALPWLYGIATNLVRRHRRDEAARLDALARHASASMDARVEEDRRMAAADDIASVVVALKKLRPKERDILFLSAWADLSYDEIALALDIPLGTVRSRLSRARHRLTSATSTETGSTEGDP
jgi:RNA polymerase sigma factor (sigma-70 family)